MTSPLPKPTVAHASKKKSATVKRPIIPPPPVPPVDDPPPAEPVQLQTDQKTETSTDISDTPTALPEDEVNASQETSSSKSTCMSSNCDAGPIQMTDEPALSELPPTAVPPAPPPPPLPTVPSTKTKEEPKEQSTVTETHEEKEITGLSDDKIINYILIRFCMCEIMPCQEVNARFHLKIMLNLQVLTLIYQEPRLNKAKGPASVFNLTLGTS